MREAVNFHEPLRVDHGWRPAIEAVLDALWPRSCLLCDRAGDCGLDLCQACCDALPWLQGGCPRCGLPSLFGLPCDRCASRPSPIQRTAATFLYGWPLDGLLPRFKFQGDLCAGRLLSRLMLRRLQHADRPDALVPIPLHRSRLRQRGHNQALELARPIAQALDLPLREDLLRRTLATAAQSSLDREARAGNMIEAFVAVAGRRGVPRHVALLDDVMTTGATLEAAAHALRALGVERVDAWVCARAE